MYKLINNETLAKLYAAVLCHKYGVCAEPVKHPRQNLFAVCLDGIPYEELGIVKTIPSIEHWKNEQAA